MTQDLVTSASTDTITVSPFTCLEQLDHRVLTSGVYHSNHAELRIGTSTIELLADGSMIEVDQDSGRTVIDEFRAWALLEIIQPEVAP